MRAMYLDSKRCASAFIFSVYSFSTVTHYPLASIFEPRMFPPCSVGIPPITVTEVNHALSL
ncbi:hypothetical protein Gohar_010052, partial [Gossypium harknessii]|nr:hypothetical protein [Gossypium harknessii]